MTFCQACVGGYTGKDENDREQDAEQKSGVHKKRGLFPAGHLDDVVPELGLDRADDLADLIAVTPNPNVAGVILDGGGHIGFIPYNRAYTYSLIVNFFDPTVGAAAMQAPRN